MAEKEKSNTSDPSPEEGGEEADDSKSPVVGKLNEVLGKEFKDEESALKAVKDTFNYVGKSGKYQKAIKAVQEAKDLSEEDAIKFVQTNAVKETKNETKGVSPDKVAELDKRAFYLENPEYKDYQRQVEVFKRANPNKSRAEIVKSEEFQEDYGKLKAHDEAKKQKSVLQSNPRLGAVKDKMAKAKEAQTKGDQGAAEDEAVDAVLDQYPQE